MARQVYICYDQRVLLPDFCLFRRCVFSVDLTNPVDVVKSEFLQDPKIISPFPIPLVSGSYFSNSNSINYSNFHLH